MRKIFSILRELTMSSRGIRPAIAATSVFMLLASASPVTAVAACPSAEAVDAYVEDVIAKRPNATYTAQLTIEQAKCARSMLISRLTPGMGPIVGYKVAFANDVLRGMYGYEEPIWGAMFAQHLLDSPATVPATYAVGRWWESALVFKIKNGDIAEAKTPLEALKSIDAVIPFIELTDYMSPNPPKFVHHVGNNANFRAGVLGAEIKVKPTRQLVNALASMRLVTSDRLSGVIYHQAAGREIMDGNPLNAAVWLARSLKQEGVVLKKGDLLSISGFTAGVWAQSGQSITATYHGLPGNPVVSVNFN